MKGKYNSIQRTIIVAFSLLIIIVINGVVWISYWITERIAMKNISENTYELVEQVNYNIEYYLTQIEMVHKDLYYNKDVQAYLNKDCSKEDIKVIEERVAQNMNSLTKARNDITNIYLFTKDGRHVIDDPDAQLKDIDIAKEDWYVNTLDAKKMRVTESRIDHLIEGSYNWVITCTHPLREWGTDESLGVLKVDLNFNIISDMCQKIKLGKKGYVFIIDSNGNIVYHPKQQLIYSNLKSEPIGKILKIDNGVFTLKSPDEGKRQYNVITSELVDWKIVGVAYIDEINKYTSKLKGFYSVLIALALGISVIISILITKKILSPIGKLTSAIQSFEKGDLDIRIDIEENNEFGKLELAFNKMAYEIKNLMKQIKWEQEQKRINEMKVLQAQINPHFLYNTLDSIIWMAEMEENKSVVEMTSALAKLFRISLNKGKEIVTVKQEIEHVHNYLKIQKMRYGSKFDYSIDVDPVMYDEEIIKLILQPIVENAIYHGIKYKEGTGKIDIVGEIINGLMKFAVRDDGIGMRQDMVSSLLVENQKSKHGVGLNNVNERIKLYYGSKYGIRVNSEEGVGTVVYITLPFTKFEKGCDEI